ncbi:MAG: hypothetical protein HY355_07135 [Armatimonadetes bacterium]|nr:hypothetical protein [Armatimonadota bacterium]
MFRLCAAALLCALVVPAALAAPARPQMQGDPQAVAEVTAAFQKFAAARTWRARMAIPGGGVNTTEFVAPDRFRMVMTQGNQTTEMFMIGREMWMRSGGTCQKLPATIPVMNPKEMAEHSGDTTITVARGGPEAVDGTPTQTYMLTVETRGTTVRQKLFVATGTGLPRRIEIQNPQGTMTVDYYDYDAQITINNPPC